MKTLLLLTALLATPSFAAIHNGKIIDNTPFICHGYFHHYIHEKDIQGAINFKGECTFSGAKLLIQTPTRFGNEFPMDLKDIDVPAYSFVVRSDDPQLNHYDYHFEWTVQIDFPDNNFSQVLR